MQLSIRNKAQAVRRPRSLRDHLVYAVVVAYGSLLANLVVLVAILSLVAYLATNDRIARHVIDWQQTDNRLMYLDQIPDNTSEECYLTLIKRLQSVSDVREDGTVEINELVWSEPSPDCAHLGPATR